MKKILMTALMAFMTMGLLVGCEEETVVGGNGTGNGGGNGDNGGNGGGTSIEWVKYCSDNCGLSFEAVRDDLQDKGFHLQSERANQPLGGDVVYDAYVYLKGGDIVSVAVIGGTVKQVSHSETADIPRHLEFVRQLPSHISGSPEFDGNITLTTTDSEITDEDYTDLNTYVAAVQQIPSADLERANAISLEGTLHTSAKSLMCNYTKYGSHAVMVTASIGEFNPHSN